MCPFWTGFAFAPFIGFNNGLPLPFAHTANPLMIAASSARMGDSPAPE